MTDVPYCILSTARAGSTALAKLLDLSENGHCASEPVPNLNRETRWALDGRIGDKEKTRIVREVLAPRLKSGMREHGIYGEKNVTYGPFVPALTSETNCRFVYLTRDGRDVVSSMIDWHTAKFGNIYRESCDSGKLQPTAISAATNLLISDDSSDYARNRPQPGDRVYEKWDRMTRSDMCAWYWNECNSVYGRALASVPEERVRRIDLDHDGVEGVAELYDWLGLHSPGLPTLKELFDKRVNSLEDRDTPNPNPAPRWPWWSGNMRDAFDDLAGQMMVDLKYTTCLPARWKPEGYGRFWQEHDGGIDWYTWMYESRRAVHEDLLSFIDSHSELQTIADFGCGLGVGYCDALADRRYVGFDLAHPAISWCKANRQNEQHDYRVCDFIQEEPDRQFDLVFSQGTIDNSYDMDEYLAAMVRWSRGWIYVTCYRGWFPELSDHRYSWNEDHACAYNDLSPKRAQQTLERLGCHSIEIAPVATGNNAIPRETRIIAQVPTRP